MTTTFLVTQEKRRGDDDCEWIVEVRDGNVRNEARTYYAADEDDARSTCKAMIAEEVENLTTEVVIDDNEPRWVRIVLPGGRRLVVALREGMTELECADISLEGEGVPTWRNGDHDVPLHKSIVFGKGCGKAYTSPKPNAVFSTVLLASTYYDEEPVGESFNARYVKAIADRS